jgi:hypothetical protein
VVRSMCRVMEVGGGRPSVCRTAKDKVSVVKIWGVDRKGGLARCAARAKGGFAAEERVEALRGEGRGACAELVARSLLFRKSVEDGPAKATINFALAGAGWTLPSQSGHRSLAYMVPPTPF